MMPMKILGIALIAFGLVDLVGSYMEFDLWGGFIGVQLPDVLWSYSSYIEMIIGYLLFSFGSKEPEEATE
jgi:hypothetical protein